jgi:hypothetical protein
MITFVMATIGFYKWQERIFDVNTDENSKDTLTKLLSNFNRFYIIMKLAYLFCSRFTIMPLLKCSLIFWHYPALASY